MAHGGPAADPQRILAQSGSGTDAYLQVSWSGRGLTTCGIMPSDLEGVVALLVTSSRLPSRLAGYRPLAAGLAMDSVSHGMRPLFVLSGTLLRCYVPRWRAPDLTSRAWLSASPPLPTGNLSLMGRVTCGMRNVPTLPS
eukprot:2698880-Amphidinium_carterae.1